MANGSALSTNSSTGNIRLITTASPVWISRIQKHPCRGRPTRALKPPVGPDWVHEIKHDGYRMIVRRGEQFCTDNPKSKPLSLVVEIGTIHSEWVGIT